ncbi:conserved hypothetical protein [Rhodobacteraceae bacterium KLH11]|nr:conserved hypothetical protein [Rhodobacteraceae bacterium KLH11]
MTLTNSAGRKVPVRFIGEQHVREDCRRIPTVADWLKALPITPWMVNGVLLEDVEIEPEDADLKAWKQAVANSQTILGYADWNTQHLMRATKVAA